MDEIKIAYFIDRIIEGGTELQLVEQINRLENNGARQVLFCLYKSDDHEKVPTNCRTEILNVRSLAKFDTLKKIIRVAKILKEYEVDIVQTYFFDSTLLGVLSAKIARVKKVISCRRDLGFWYTNKLLSILKIVNLFTDRIIVNSNAVKQNVAKYELTNPSKIDIIKNGIDTKRYKYSREYRATSRKQLGLSENDVSIGIIANMSRTVKRVDLLIKAAKKISEYKNIKIIIKGEGFLKEELMQMARRYNIMDRITFLNRNYRKDSVLAALDIGVITSDSEGLSNSIMEYMAAGLPTIATRVGGNPELVEDRVDGLLFEKGNADQLADRILYISKEKDIRSRYSNAARKKIKAYDWTNKINEIKSYYQYILTEGN